MGVSGCQFVKPDEAKLVLMKEGKGLVPIIVFKDAHSEYPRAILAAARILVSQQKNDEALALLAKYDTSRSKTYGRRVLEASGDIYFIMGKKDKALAKYEEIRKFITGLNAQKKSSYYERCIERMNKKMDALK